MEDTYIQDSYLKAKEKLKLAIKLFILIGFFITIMAIISYTCFIKITEKNAMDYNMELVQNASSSIDAYLSNIEKDLEVLSISKDIQSIADGEENETTENLLKRFEEYSNVHEEVENIFLATPDKRAYIYQHSNKYVTMDLTERSYYIEAVNTKDYVWSENYYSKATGKVVKLVAKAIFINDELIGVLGIQIDFSIIEEKLSNTPLGETGYMMLLDEEGKVLIHPRIDLIGSGVEIDDLQQTLKNNYDIESVVYTKQKTGNVMICYTTNKGDFIVAGSVLHNELVNNNKRLLLMLILLVIINTIILTLCAFVITIAYSKKQEKLIHMQRHMNDGNNNKLMI